MKKILYLLLGTLVSHACMASSPLRISRINLQSPPRGSTDTTRIDLTAQAGVPPYSYSYQMVPGGDFIPNNPPISNVFVVEGEGIRDFRVTDSEGDFQDVNVTIGPSEFAEITLTIAPDPFQPRYVDITVESVPYNPNAPTPIHELKQQNGSQISLQTMVGDGTFAPTIEGERYQIRSDKDPDDGMLDSNIIVNLIAPGLVTGTVDITGCSTVLVLPMDGTPPYMYSLDGGPFQLDPEFTNVAGGEHTITIKDANGITATIDFEVENSIFCFIEDKYCNGGPPPHKR